jgi:hypothetical protein
MSLHMAKLCLHILFSQLILGYPNEACDQYYPRQIFDPLRGVQHSKLEAITAAALLSPSSPWRTDG